MSKSHLSTRFRQNHPHLFFLDPQQPLTTTQFLQRHHLISPTARVVDMQPAGEGNMNCTLRITLHHPPGSIIIKQARPWVEKYPDIEAPWDRAHVEAAFFKQVAQSPSLAACMPTLLFADSASRTLVFSDLGHVDDCSTLYQTRSVPEKLLTANSLFLQDLHGLDTSHMPSLLRNNDMRKLQGFHMFIFPLQTDNAFDLNAMTPGLQEVANNVKNNKAYLNARDRLHEVFHQNAHTLVHGDFHPGSWMQTQHGHRYIDPEFSFLGPKEFDLGVMLAHYTMIQCQAPSLTKALGTYPHHYDQRNLYGFAGIEIMRRLLGVAQLPLQLSLEEKSKLLKISQTWVTS